VTRGEGVLKIPFFDGPSQIPEKAGKVVIVVECLNSYSLLVMMIV